MCVGVCVCLTTTLSLSLSLFLTLTGYLYVYVLVLKYLKHFVAAVNISFRVVVPTQLSRTVIVVVLTASARTHLSLYMYPMELKAFTVVSHSYILQYTHICSVLEGFKVYRCTDQTVGLVELQLNFIDLSPTRSSSTSAACVLHNLHTKCNFKKTLHTTEL